MDPDILVSLVQHICVYLLWLNSVRTGMLAMAQNAQWQRHGVQQDHELGRQLANPLAQEVFLKGLRMLAYTPFLRLEDPRNESGHSQFGIEEPPLANALERGLQVLRSLILYSMAGSGCDKQRSCRNGFNASATTLWSIQLSRLRIAKKVLLSHRQPDGLIILVVCGQMDAMQALRTCHFGMKSSMPQ